MPCNRFLPGRRIGRLVRSRQTGKQRRKAGVSEVKIAFVVAMGNNNAIGKEGGMPWHMPADLAYFKRMTMGKPMLMGRKTFESIGRPLPGRDSIVVTRDRGWKAPGAIVVHDIETGLKFA
ncbi:MAG: dihydrofolate reductase, partial [Proteobacteria bacterium]|nr:dihydrofolate reductase [Pseudomonadota bacterium]